jgi:hypothetical protein
MPINATYEFEEAEKKFHLAEGILDKLKALQEMLAKAPSHKGAEKLRKNIKEKIKKYKDLAAKEKKTKKGSSFLSVKKEGAARVVIIGLTNTGKSTLLSQLTNAKPIISEVEFTTKLPEIGMMDYHGVKIQIVEIPAITKKYNETKHGSFFMSIVKESNLMIITLNKKDDLEMIKKELKENDVNKRFILYEGNPESLKKDLWNNLNLIKVYTKQPGKNKEHPPIAMNKGSTVRDLALEVHKDFLKKFDYARVWGKSAKHDGSRVGLNHRLFDDDMVEFHTK